MENIFQKLCRLLTKHRFRYYYGNRYEWGESPEWYCRCRLCHYRFWTDKKPKKMNGWVVEDG